MSSNIKICFICTKLSFPISEKFLFGSCSFVAGAHCHICHWFYKHHTHTHTYSMYTKDVNDSGHWRITVKQVYNVC